jgi:hypothetical protein
MLGLGGLKQHGRAVEETSIDGFEFTEEFSSIRTQRRQVLMYFAPGVLMKRSIEALLGSATSKLVPREQKSASSAPSSGPRVRPP